MIIKKYAANTLEEAMELLRQELGPDAMVLTKRHVKSQGLLAWFTSGKIEVTAAIDEADLKAFTNSKEEKPEETTMKKKKGPTSVTHGQEELSDSLAELKKSLGQTSSMSSQTAPVLKDTGVYSDPRGVGTRTATAGMKNTGSGQDLVSLSSDAQRLRSTPPTQTPPSTFTRNEETASQQVTEKKGEAEAQELASGLLHATQGLLSAFREEVQVPQEVTQAPRKVPQIQVEEKREEQVSDPEALRAIIREEMQRAQRSVSVGTTTRNDEGTVGSVRFLMGKGIARPIAVEIEEKLIGQLGSVDLGKPSPRRKLWLQQLKVELEKRVETAGPLTLDANTTTFAALVGPHGVGKTTTLAKIAAQYSSKLGRRVGVISLDTEKVGAREQIRGLTDHLNIPLLTASTTEELRQAAETFADRQLVLIDTAGCSQYHSSGLNILSEMLTSVPHLQILLTLSATTKDLDALGAAQQFSRMPIDSLIFTKLDETIAHGIVINVCQKMKLPVRYLTAGGGLAGELMIAEAGIMARNLLIENNAEEYDGLRRLVSA